MSGDLNLEGKKMGYTTTFKGKFLFNKHVDDVTFKLIDGLHQTRRMVHNVDAALGIEGEFFIDPNWRKDPNGQEDSTVVDHNTPPRTQPSLWLQWGIHRGKDGMDYLSWNRAEKFYSYVDWLVYLLDKIIVPRGYVLSGSVFFQGEDARNYGKITITQNRILIEAPDERVHSYAHTTYTYVYDAKLKNSVEGGEYMPELFQKYVTFKYWRDPAYEEKRRRLLIANFRNRCADGKEPKYTMHKEMPCIQCGKLAVIGYAYHSSYDHKENTYYKNDMGNSMDEDEIKAPVCTRCEWVPFASTFKKKEVTA